MNFTLFGIDQDLILWIDQLYKDGTLLHSSFFTKALIDSKFN